MPKQSAGLLMYRIREACIEVLLVHPGGPLWKNKDVGAWSIPKGEAAAGEPLLDVARREFYEETGITPVGPFAELRPVRLKSGKLVHAWAFAGDCDPASCRSNTFRLEWPPRSGRFQDFPEVDRAEFFDVETARRKVNAAQVAFIEQLAETAGTLEPR